MLICYGHESCFMMDKISEVPVPMAIPMAMVNGNGNVNEILKEIALFYNVKM